jgi:hypothetical protein
MKNLLKSFPRRARVRTKCATKTCVDLWSKYIDPREHVLKWGIPGLDVLNLKDVSLVRGMYVTS